ncbi:MAG: carboxypeptidase-like regulatory domain-containing protein, partial [Planctomycetota bacterium]|nr:carboxypeptidase-like regulatory domain-containing protein [Planctomycetota bacterium]
VRGRVVRAAGGVPLAGVRVTLGRYDSIVTYLRAQANGRYDELEARTGSDGRFAFLDVTPARGYVVRARHPEFAIASSDDGLDLTGRDALDVGDLALGQGGTLAGRVVDTEGRPLPKVRVAITWRISNPLGVILADPATAPEIERTVVTGADGRFVAERLDPTPKTIIAVAPAGAAQVVRSVTLEIGEVKSLDDIRMPGQGTLAGKVVWADGTPIPGARVFGAPMQEMSVRAVESDAAGRFRIDWLPEGEAYAVGALVEGLPVQLVQGLALGDEDVRIEFALPGMLRGRVVLADGSGPVPQFALALDAAEPSPNWQLRFMMEQVKRGLGPTPFGAADGSFVLPRVAAGTYTVTVSAPGHPDIARLGVQIIAGQETELVLEIPRGNVGRGIVRKANGEPLAHARVYVVQHVAEGVAGPGLDAYLHGREPDAVSGGDGRFELPPQTPGTYALIAAHPEVLAGALRGVDLAAGDVHDLEVRMPPSGSVRGILLDETARPAKGELVYVLYRSGIVRTVNTEDDGRFRIAGLPVGRCLVRWMSLLDVRTYQEMHAVGKDEAAREAAYDKLRIAHGEHDLRDGMEVEATLRIPGRTLVSGRWRVAGEVPTPEARTFFVTIEGGGHWLEVEVQEDGTYEIRLLPGAYLFYGQTSGGDYEAREVVVPAATAHVLDIDLE